MTSSVLIAAERAGYTLEARLRNAGRRLDGTLEDELVYAMVRDQFLSRELPPIRFGGVAESE